MILDDQNQPHFRFRDGKPMPMQSTLTELPLLIASYQLDHTRSELAAFEWHFQSSDLPILHTTSWFAKVLPVSGIASELSDIQLGDQAVLEGTLQWGGIEVTVEHHLECYADDRGRAVIRGVVMKSDVSVRYKQRAEELMLMNSSRFASLPHHSVPQFIQIFIEEIGELFKADMAYACRFDRAKGTVHQIAFWTSQSFGSETEDGEFLFKEKLPWKYNHLLSGRDFIIADLSEMPAIAAKDKAYLEQLGIMANASIPFKHSDDFVGFVGLATQQKRIWKSWEINMLRWAGYITLSATLRRRSVQQLEESEQRFKSFIQQSEDAIWCIQYKEPIDTSLPPIEQVPLLSQGILVECNQAYLDYYSQDVIGKTSLEIANSFGRNFEKLILEYIAAGYKLHDHISIYKNADGKKFYYSNKAMGVFENGKLVATWGNFRDVTLKHSYLQNLEESEERSRLILENAREGILIYNLKRQLVFANPMASKLHGMSLEEMLEIAPYGLIDPDTIPLLAEKTTALKEGSLTEFGMQGKGLRYDGSTFVISLFGCLIKLDRKPHLYLAVRDMTEELAATEKIKKHNQELKKLNSELDKFVYSVSHDIKAPLSSCIGLLDLMGYSTDQQEQAQYQQMMRSSLTKLEGFIEDILSYSRNSRTQINHAEIRLDELVRQVVDSLTHATDLAAVTAISEVPKSTIIYTDEQRLNIILKNLISNALKYHQKTSDQKPLVRIQYERSEQYDVLTIIDNGIGIEEKYLDRIFDMFFRATEVSRGSGLGLYLVKETVETLGGKIEATSEYGKGSTFRVSIPKAIEPSQSPMITAKTAPLTE